MAKKTKKKSKFTVMPLNKKKKSTCKLRSDERVGENGKVYRVKKTLTTFQRFRIRREIHKLKNEIAIKEIIANKTKKHEDILELINLRKRLNKLDKKIGVHLKSKMVEGVKNLTKKQVEEGKLFFQNPDDGGVEFPINEFPIKEWKFKAEPQSPFDESVNNRLAKIKELLLIKGAEYIRNNDKYHNFKRTAEMNRTTETRALHGMNSKHLVSILDMLDDIDAGKKIEVKFVEEKIGDLMVYLVVLEALIKEKYSSPGF